MIRISVVLPASVAPSSTLMPPAASDRSMSRSHSSDPDAVADAAQAQALDPVPSAAANRCRSASDMCKPSLLRRHRMSSSVMRPFVAREIVDFRGGEAGAVMLAEIGKGLGAADDLLDACAVRACESPRDRDGQEAPAPANVDDEAAEISRRQIAARERRAVRPATRAAAERVLQFFEHGFGEAPIGRELAAEDRQQRGMLRRLRELDSIVARDARSALRCVVEQRPHAGVRPAHVARRRSNAGSSG